MKARPRPCQQCPWRKDVEPGQFPADRYERLRCTTQDTTLTSPMFGCHKSSEDAPLPCAGWLAAVGLESLPVRLSLAVGALPPEAVQRGDDWPELWGSYEEMMVAQGGPENTWSVCLMEGCHSHAVPQTVTPGHPCPTCGRGEMVAVPEEIIERIKKEAGVGR